MIKSFELAWKVSGVLPAPTEHLGKYFAVGDDATYSMRVFGNPELTVLSRPLAPTKQFCQALESEIRDKHQISIGHSLNQLRAPLTKLGDCSIGLKFRILGNAVLVLTIQIQRCAHQLSIAELIPLQMLSNHPVLESIARFCFNVHYAPSPSSVDVEAFQSKPLVKIEAEPSAMRVSELAALVTRHIGLNDRATQEMLAKNEPLNFNDDLVFIDKQGMAFLLATEDSRNQRNRFTRIAALCEFAIYATTVYRIATVDDTGLLARVDEEIERINAVVEATVLAQSVGASRAWELLKKEFGVEIIERASRNDNIVDKSKREKLPFYKHPAFLGTSALIGVVGGVVRLLKYFGGK